MINDHAKEELYLKEKIGLDWSFDSYNTNQLINSETVVPSINDDVYDNGNLYKITGFSLTGVKISKKVKT